LIVLEFKRYPCLSAMNYLRQAGGTPLPRRAPQLERE
jgi:hypothetical protein